MAVLTNGTWVLIADGEKALFLRNRVDAIAPTLDVVRKSENDNPSNLEQSTDRAGRKQDAGAGQRSPMDDTDWHRLSKERFAHDLADILYTYAHRGAFDRIVVVAAPHVLGDLRDHLLKDVRDKVVAEVAKDLTHHPLDKVETMLKAELDPRL